jgi:hypothetical protein
MEPLILQLLLLLFVADLTIRRWENARGMLEMAAGLTAALRGRSAGGGA